MVLPSIQSVVSMSVMCQLTVDWSSVGLVSPKPTLCPAVTTTISLLILFSYFIGQE